MAEADIGTWEGRVGGAWASDPWGRHRFRWHDGVAWTEHVSNGASTEFDPIAIVASATDRPSSAEIIERLVQSARAAIDAQVPPRTSAPPPPPPPSPVSTVPTGPPTRPPSALVKHGAGDVREAESVGASSAPRRRPPWRWIVAGVAIPVAVWLLFNARDRDDTTASVEPTAESTTTTAATTTTTTTTIATGGTVEVDSVPPGAVTAPPIEAPDPQLVERCVEFAQFAAYIGDPEMSAFWTNAGLNVDTLRANCAALPTSELERLSQRKADMDLFMNGGAATTVP
jgi:Protein of unknown function (DUF2510)